MPRGVAIPELRDQLFQAAEQVLLRDGPSALSSRAITSEAGCAKGVLHNHFTDLDGFLAEFVLSRFQAALDQARRLDTKAGRGTVHDNVAEAATALVGSSVLAVHGILMVRPQVAARLRTAHGHRSPNLADLENVFACYLDAEKQLGRVLPDANTGAVAMALVATVQRLLMSHHTSRTHAGPELGEVLDLLLSSISA